MPQVDGFFAIRDNLAFVKVSGYRLPPCIVMERGESLDEGSKRRKSDMWAAMPVRVLMHEFGYAHCDLKPASVICLPCHKMHKLP
jgi:hypothetical protein